jgi:2'-5' RNA ligase
MFVAVWPDAATVGVLAALDLGPAGGLRVVGPADWHVTLRFLGEVDEGLTPGLIEALAVAAERLPGSIRCRVGPGTAWFSGERVLQVPVGGLDGVAAAVHSATLPLVPDPERGRPRVTGHLTLARTRGSRLSTWERRGLAGIPCATTFDVDHVDLVASRPAEPGRRYATLARVPLGEVN